jgi:hypothetical protein
MNTIWQSTDSILTRCRAPITPVDSSPFHPMDQLERAL